MEVQREKEINRREKENVAQARRALTDREGEETKGESIQRWKQQRTTDERVMQRLREDVQRLKEQLASAQKEGGPREERERERQQTNDVRGQTGQRRRA